MRRITILSGGAGHPSSSLLLAEALASRLSSLLADADIAIVETRDHVADLGAALDCTGMSAELSAAMDTVAASDALIVASPVMKGSFSGTLKLFLDVADPGMLRGTPVALVATGGSERHALMIDHALRPLLTFMRTYIAPTGVFATPEDLATLGSGGELDGRLDRVAGELERLLGGYAGVGKEKEEAVSVR